MDDKDLKALHDDLTARLDQQRQVCAAELAWVDQQKALHRDNPSAMVQVSLEWLAGFAEAYQEMREAMVESLQRDVDRLCYAPSDGKFGTVITERGAFHPGEPLFILRAQDAAAPAAIAHYGALCERAGSPEEHTRSLADVVIRFVEWGNAHPDLVKRPD